jgi:hypothetical protein
VCVGGSGAKPGSGSASKRGRGSQRGAGPQSGAPPAAAARRSDAPPPLAPGHAAPSLSLTWRCRGTSSAASAPGASPSGRASRWTSSSERKGRGGPPPARRGPPARRPRARGLRAGALRAPARAPLRARPRCRPRLRKRTSARRGRASPALSSPLFSTPSPPPAHAPLQPAQPPRPRFPAHPFPRAAPLPAAPLASVRRAAPQAGRRGPLSQLPVTAGQHPRRPLQPRARGRPGTPQPACGAPQGPRRRPASARCLSAGRPAAGNGPGAVQTWLKLQRYDSLRRVPAPWGGGGRCGARRQQREASPGGGAG